MGSQPSASRDSRAESSRPWPITTCMWLWTTWESSSRFTRLSFTGSSTICIEGSPRRLPPPTARRLFEVMTEGWLLGIEIGGTKLKLGLGRREAGLCALERRSVEPSGGAAAILDEIKRTFRLLLEQN